VLRARGSRGDLQRCRELAEEAAKTAQELGLARLETRARALLGA